MESQSDIPGTVPDASPRPDRIGIVAGGGRFPFLVAEGAARLGVKVIGAGIRYEASPDLAQVCDQFSIFSLGRLGAVLRYFKRHGVREVVWAGWIRKERIYRPWRVLRLLPDWRMIRIFYFRMKNRQDAALLGTLADEFEKEGIHVVHSTKYSPELLAEEGVLTRRRPTQKQLQDIRFGWGIAKRLADLDVGQSVVVSDMSTIAVEGIEGTDRNIRRAGELCPRGGFSVVKVAKDRHDMRFDIPTVGLKTLETCAASGVAVLGVEADRTLLLEREPVATFLRQHRLTLTTVATPPGSDLDI
jgi:hypothetical protein